MTLALKDLLNIESWNVIKQNQYKYFIHDYFVSSVPIEYLYFIHNHIVSSNYSYLIMSYRVKEKIYSEKELIIY